MDGQRYDYLTDESTDTSGHLGFFNSGVVVSVHVLQECRWPRYIFTGPRALTARYPGQWNRARQANFAYLYQRRLIARMLRFVPERCTSRV